MRTKEITNQEVNKPEKRTWYFPALGLEEGVEAETLEEATKKAEALVKARKEGE